MSKKDIITLFDRGVSNIPWTERLELNYEIGFSFYCMSQGIDKAIVNKLGDDPVFEGWMKAWMLNCSHYLEVENQYDRKDQAALFKVVLEERKMLLGVLKKDE